MDSVVGVAIGAAIGCVSSIATTALAAYFERVSKYPKYDKAIKSLLVDLLEKKRSWRSLKTLSSVTGLNEKHLKEYLIEIKARGSETNPDLWGLISEHPISEIKTESLNESSVPVIPSVTS